MAMIKKAPFCALLVIILVLSENAATAQGRNLISGRESVHCKKHCRPLGGVKEEKMMGFGVEDFHPTAPGHSPSVGHSEEAISIGKKGRA